MNLLGDLDFTSRYCKAGIDQHSLCAGAWIGLGLEVNCNCTCHRKDYEKNEQVERGELPISTLKILESVSQPVANTTHVSSKEGTIEDDD